MKKVLIYTDGACSGNPGVGGYASVLIYGEHTKEIAGGFRMTTNNRMELFAAIAALRSLKEPCVATIITDSQYLFNGITKGWARRWQQKGWQRGRQEVPNRELWEELLVLSEKHQLVCEWTPGHSANAGNERCDHLARAQIKQNPSDIDQPYEQRHARQESP
jgi:ribonuclease HI